MPLLSPLPVQKFFDNNAVPLVGGKLFTYISGTSVKTATYTDFGGLTQNTNPIILNSRGEARIWLSPTQAYKFVLSPSTDTDPPTNPIWTVDNIFETNTNFGTGYFADGSAAAPSITFTNSQAAGFFLKALNDIGISTNGAERGHIGDAGNWVVAAPSSGASISVISVGGTATGVDVSAGAGAPCGISIRGNAMPNGRGLRLNVDGSGNAQIYLVNPGASLGIGANGSNALLFSPTGDITGRGVALCAFKATATSRTTITTLANDPDLAIAVAAAGTYKFSILLQVSQGGGGAIGIKLNTNFSGTVTNPGSYAITATRNAAAGFAGGVNLSISSTVNNSLISAANVSTVVGIDYFQFEGVLTCSTAGTFAVAWSQNTSSATATQVDIGSCLTIEPLS